MSLVPASRRFVKFFDTMVAIGCLFLLIVGVYSFNEVDLSTCTVTKGCLRPPICPGNLCEYGATWRLVEQDEIKYVEFELFGDIKSSNGFISLVFSRDPYFVSETQFIPTNGVIFSIYIFSNLLVFILFIYPEFSFILYYCRLFWFPPF